MIRPRRPIPSPSRLSPAPARRGSVYILVLGAATMVAVVGIGAVALARSSIRATTAAADWAEAGIAAQGGVEYMVAVMNSVSTWRTDLKSGKPYGPFAIGRAKVNVTLVDQADADLSNDATQPCRVYAVATVNNVTRTYSAMAECATTIGLDLLRCPLHSASDITISGNTTASLGPISSNGKISNSAQLTSDIETSTLSSTGFINGYVQTGVAAKTMPGDTALNNLSSIATTIPFSSISGGVIDRQILTSSLNTISSTTNPSGVYAISVPLLSTLKIRRSRLQASLVITLAATSSLVVLDENLWDPASSNYPALVVQGSLASVTLGGSSSSASLSESTIGMNFNPAAAPYNGVSDSDTLDTYPSELHGIYHIYSPLSLTINNNLKCTGCIIAAGAVTLNTPATLVANPSLVTSPPNGYSDPARSQMRISQGTYRWEVTNVHAAVTP